MRHLRTRAFSAALCAAVAAAPSVRADEQHPATCKGLIAVMDAAIQSGDPLGPQAYVNLADAMYKSINSAMIRRGVPPLPLPNDENSEGSRELAVIVECKANPSLTYAEAVTYAYVKLRQVAGLPVALPPP